MSVADEIRKLQDLRQSGALSDEEFATAKAAVLAGKAPDPPAGPGLGEHLAEIKQQNAVAQLDREWAIEREQYMIVGRYGHRYIPNRGMSLMGGLAVAAFGLIWIVIAASMGAPSLFPVFGVLFILFGIGVSAYSFGKAGEYEAAYNRYQRRRTDLLARQRDRATEGKE